MQGSAATLELSGPFYQPGEFSLRGIEGSVLGWEEAPVAHGALHFQAAEVARRLSAGETGSPLRPVADTITTMATMDEVRGQLGIVYAEES